jgi:formylglycine-generating enzyme required for sulfatase activity
MAGKIFINYRRAQSLREAQHLKTLLDQAFGEKRVFLDVRGIDGGDNWLQTLERQVAACEAMAVLIGKEWADLKDEQGNRRLDDPNDKVRFEISQALLRNLPIVPISIDGAAIPKHAQPPDNIMQLANFQAMPLRAESFPQDAAAIIGRLRVLLAKQRRHGVPLWRAAPVAATVAVAGIAAGPWVFSRLSLPLWGVTVPGGGQSFEEIANALVAAENRAKDAENERDSNSEKIAALQKKQDDFSQRLVAAQRERDGFREGLTIRDCSDCPEMVVVPAGKFLMRLLDGYPNERGIREGTIARPFAVGKYEVTFAEWDACAAAGGCASNETPNDQGWGRGRQPVINVSWNDAKEYVTWLSGKTGQNYRLLAEAEWEYAALAGSPPTIWGNSNGTGIANCQGCGSQWDDKQAAPVGSFPANAFGLHDTHGNVSEWCEDSWHPDYNGNPPKDGSVWAGGDTSFRVVRGASWNSLAWSVRGRLRPDIRGSNLGFRIARTL